MQKHTTNDDKSVLMWKKERTECLARLEKLKKIEAHLLKEQESLDRYEHGRLQQENAKRQKVNQVCAAYYQMPPNEIREALDGYDSINQKARELFEICLLDDYSAPDASDLCQQVQECELLKESKPDTVFRLINNAGILPAIFQSFSQEVQQKLLYCYTDNPYTNLISTEVIPLEVFQGLGEEDQKKLLDHSHSFEKLIPEANIPLETLLALDPEVLQKLLDNAYDVARLIVEGGISLDTLLALDPEVLQKLLDNAYAVAILIVDGGISLDTLLALDPEVLQKLLDNADAVAILIVRCGISLDTLLDNEDAVAGIPLDKLLALDPELEKTLLELNKKGQISFEQACLVINNPQSEEAQQILKTPLLQATIQKSDEEELQGNNNDNGVTYGRGSTSEFFKPLSAVSHQESGHEEKNDPLEKRGTPSPSSSPR